MTHTSDEVLAPPRIHARLGAMRWRLFAYVALVAVVGIASLFIPPTWMVAPDSWLPALMTLTLISIVLEFLTVPLPMGGSFSMATVPHVATILLVPAPFAALSIGVSVLAEEVAHRVAPQKAAFNAGGMILTASIASFLMGSVGTVWQARATTGLDLTLLAPLVVVALTYFGVNALLLGGVFSIVERRSIFSVLWRGSGTTLLGELATTAIGAQFALIWIVEPVVVVVLAIPALVIARSFDHIRRLTTETRAAVRSLAEIVDHRDATTYHHSTRVAQNAVRLARVLGLSATEVELIEQSASVHDLGKIGVPDRVLLKPGALTRAEAAMMRQHTELGSAILSRFELFRPGAKIVRHHHERWDGTGYPDGLTGVAIPLGARVVAVADAFDAMTSDRPYRAALSDDEAARRLEAGAGSLWEPRIVAAFLRMLSDGEPVRARPGGPDTRRAAARSATRAARADLGSAKA